MILIGNKTILRAIEPEDTDLLLNLINDPETEYLLGGWSFPISAKDQLDWINNLKSDNSTLRCIITEKESKHKIGTVILNKIDFKNGNAAIHIKISGEGFRGKGFGADAIHTVVQYAFKELRLHCVYAHVNQDNIGSTKLFEKCGFEIEGILRERLYKRGKFLNVQSYSIINK